MVSSWPKGHILQSRGRPVKLQGGRGARKPGFGLVWVWLGGCRGCRVVGAGSRVVVERDRGKRGLMGQSGLACDV